MGRVKGIISSLINKATSYIDRPDEIIDPSPEKLSAYEEEKYVMPVGKRLSDEEIFEENKKLLEVVDPKIYRILLMINELNPDMDAINDMAENSLFMKVWLAHVSYLDRINSFGKLVQGLAGTPGYSMLSTKQQKLRQGNSNIKCLTDLPLQKKLLN